MFAGCASVVTKTVYPVQINSVPAGAKIYIFNSMGEKVYEGLTPAVVHLQSSAGFYKRAAYSVTFIKDGFEEEKAYIRCKVDGWYYGNIFLGIIPGMLVVDPATGAMYKIENDRIMKSLTPLPNYSLNTATLRIYGIDDIPNSMKDRLVLISD